MPDIEERSTHAAPWLGIGVSLVTVAIPLLRGYLMNASSFSIGFATVLVLVTLAAACTSVLVVGSISLARARGRTLFMGFWSFVLIGSWLVSNLFAWQLGLFRGRKIDIREFMALVIIEILALAAVGSLVLFLRREVFARMRTLAIVLAVWSAAALMPTVTAYMRLRDTHKGSTTAVLDSSDDKLIRFSRTRNVIVFLLDNVQANIVKEIILARPDIAARFHGFTFYNDTATAFSYTHLSVPALLTGRVYSNSQPLYRFLDEAYVSSGSVPHRLRLAGYDSRATSYFSEPYSRLSELWDNAVSDVRLGDDIANLIRLALFNVTPLPIKARLSDDIWFDATVRTPLRARLNRAAAPSTSRCEAPPITLSPQLSVHTLSDDIRLVERLLGCSSAEVEQPAFRYYHLQAAHPPFYVLARGQRQEAKWMDEGDYVRQVTGVMELIAQIMDRLRKIQAYDNATIVILSDHGAGEDDIHVNLETYHTDPTLTDGAAPPNRLTGQSLRLIGQSLALMMIKAPREDRPLSYSNAQVSTTDLSPTLLAAAELPHSGTSIFSLSEDAKRTRSYHTFTDEGFAVQYIRDLNRYQIDGPVWEPASWSSGQPVPMRSR